MSTEETIFGEQTTMPSVPSIEYGDAVKLTVMKNGRVLGRNGCFRYVLQWKDKDGGVVHEEFQSLPPNCPFATSPLGLYCLVEIGELLSYSLRLQ